MDKIVATQMVGGNPNGQRAKSDFYPTPPDVTIALLRFLSLPKEKVIWEPACGDGDMVNAMQQHGYSVIATDIRYGMDFLKAPTPECDWIITNPPFSLSDKFIERCAEHGKPFALLLKSQYWHAKKRFELFQRITPDYVCPLTWRPDFLFKQEGTHGSPLMDVQWCIWLPPYGKRARFLPLRRDGDA